MSRVSVEEMLPNFLVIGAMKAGTTSLYRYLIEHPDVFMAQTKEPMFFNSEFNWDRGIEWYEDLFRDSKGAHAIGEASTTYAKYPLHLGVPARIAETLPRVKMIYLVRHPIERARSEWAHWVFDGRERLPFDRALRENDLYLAFSSYTTQLEQYLPYFPKDRILVLASEDLKRNRHDTLERIFSFLEVRPDWTPATIETEFHQSSQKRKRRRWAEQIRQVSGYRRLARFSPEWLRRFHYRVTTDPIPQQRSLLSAETEAWATQQLRDEVAGLRAFMGDDFHGWGIA